VKCTGYVKNPVNDAAAFETAVAKMPQAITVAADSWQLYGGGIFKGCSHGGIFGGGNTLDHGVQAVGYTKDYWIVRNSWGQAGARRALFASRGPATTRHSPTKAQQMVWRASHTPKLKRLAESAESFSTHLTPLVWQQLMSTLSSEARSSIF